MSDHAIAIAAGVVVVGVLIGVISNWIDKPTQQSGAFGHTHVKVAAPPVRPSLTESSSPRAHKVQSPRARPDHSAVVGQSGQHPQPSSSKPAIDAANEVLSATMSPDDIHNTGQDVSVQVTVTNATPGGQVTWEENARRSGSYPGQTPCLSIARAVGAAWIHCTEWSPPTVRVLLSLI